MQAIVSIILVIAAN